VDGLEQDMRGELKVVRLDVNSEAGRELGARWRAGFTPTFILFDGAGREIWRGLGALDPDTVRAALAKP
jgi:thioredoxin-related protein